MDILIIGGGLAGSHLANHLLQKGASVHVIHNNGALGSCASLAPATLYNPAAALQAKKSIFAEESYTELLAFIASLSEKETNIIQQNGVLRPATDARLYENFKRSAKDDQWPSSWIEWMEKDELMQRYPELHLSNGGLLINIGMTINAPLLIELLHQRILSAGGYLIDGKVLFIKKREKNWIVTLEDGNEYLASKIVFATGFGIKSFNEWAFLKLHAVKGETLTISNPPISFPHAISSRGYLAFSNNKLTIGSTYNHSFNQLKPDITSKKYLLNKWFSHFPDFDIEQNEMELWSGVRLSTPDRLPIVGAHPTLSNLYILTGFGSKGLMYSIIAAQDLVANMLDYTPVRDAFSINRFL